MEVYFPCSYISLYDLFFLELFFALYKSNPSFPVYSDKVHMGSQDIILSYVSSLWSSSGKTVGAQLIHHHHNKLPGPLFSPVYIHCPLLAGY